MMELSYRRHRFPPVVIRHAVWFYLRFTLSYRDVEDLLAERGFDVSYETVRSWVLKFAARKAARSRAVDRYRRTRGRARLAVRRASPGGADLRRIAGPRRRSPKPHLHHDCGARRALRRSPCACPRGKGRRCRSRTHRAPLGRSSPGRSRGRSAISAASSPASRSTAAPRSRRRDGASAQNLAPPATGKRTSVAGSRRRRASHADAGGDARPSRRARPRRSPRARSPGDQPNIPATRFNGLWQD
jgi:hypothetical protein